MRSSTRLQGQDHPGDEYFNEEIIVSVSDTGGWYPQG